LELKRKNAAKRNAQTVPKYIRGTVRDPPSVFHTLAPGQHPARSASQRGGVARHEDADGSRTALAQRRGELSELAFFYKAASLGFGVAKPWGDSEPYDFILDSGQRLWRVQLKSASHHFNRRYDVHAKRGKDEKVMYTSADIDILVAYLIPIDVWYVIPVEKIEKKALYFYPYGGARHARHEAYREAWGLMAPQTSDVSFLSGSLENGRGWPGYLNPRFL
jgi:hypothetical protein